MRPSLIRLHHLVACCIAWSASAGAPPKPATPPSPGRERISATPSSVLSLEGAYDRAVASDQDIGIAFLQKKVSDLESWRALARLEPRASGSLGWGRTDETRLRATRTDTDSTLGENRNLFRSSETSTLVPRNTFDSTIGERDQSTMTQTPTDSFSRGLRNSTNAFTFEQPLVDLTVFPAWRAGKLSSQSARLECQFIVRQVLFTVTRAYYEVLRTEAVAKVDRETVELAQQQLDLAQTRFDAGIALRTDVLRAKAALESARQLLAQSTAAVRGARTALAVVLNLPPTTLLNVVGPAKGSVDLDSLDGARSRAFARREDYQVSALTIERDRQLRKTAEAAFLPRLSAQVRIGSLDDHGDTYTQTAGQTATTDQLTRHGSSTDLTTGLSTPVTSLLTSKTESDLSSRSSQHVSTSTTDWEAMLVVQMPMWGHLTLDRRQASLQLSQAVLQREKVANQIEQEVTDSWLAVQTLRQTLTSLRAEVTALDQSYVDLRHQYEAGTATILDSLVALHDLNAARSMLVSQAYGYEVALRQLQRVTGDIQQERIGKLKFEK